MDATSSAADFTPVDIPHADDCAAVAAACRQYETALRSVVTVMLDRFERDPAYGLIDMKVDLLTGRDFDDDDPIRGRGAVYGWIQGRALESLAGHAAWMGRGPMQDRIKSATYQLMERTERLRADAGGRLRFLMTPQGQALTIDPAGRPSPIANDGPSHFSDLFYAKGLAAAAALLDDQPRLAEAGRMFDRCVTDLTEGRFVSDQEQLDARNPVRHATGHVPHGPWMIAIGGALTLANARGDVSYDAVGRSMIEHVLDHYTNDAGEMWEVNDASGRPLVADGILRNDPGHATEFVGLSLKLLSWTAKPPAELLDRLGRVLKRNFRLGFSSRGFGMVKSVDLIGGKAINTDMPWWNLPETMRAAVLAWSLTQDRAYAEIARRCSNAFMRYYLRPDRWLMANQTLDETGTPVARIPATPDADPGYHTGLSLIDVLAVLRPFCQLPKK